jgi:F-type H+-transporting ATPase subunit delta
VAATDQNVSGVPGRYASALFELANEQKAVPATAQALNGFQAVVDESEELQRVMQSPVFKAEDQLAAIDAIAAKGKLSGIALNFLRVMAQNRRLAAVPAAIGAFNTLVAQAKGETTAEVTSAEALSAKQVADLKTALKAAIGSDVVLTSKIDPAILGGLIVKVGSRMMDNSLRTKLNSLKVTMKGTA